ncbi:DUF4255 domain-containing protein [Chitinivorax sp. PXF-14]|uniref:DUF4255 domain-containing protein n=1 Tax=Chitinivorax sp. PXF-14 TaxID=3230488 RepID=UPI003467E70C
MATFNAAAAVSKAVLGLIQEHYPRALLLSPRFELYTTAQFAEPMAEGFSLCLYRVALNTIGRNLPLRRTADGRLWRPSLPVDLHYMLTPWAADGERQQRLLGWAARFIEDRAVLPASVINSYMPEPDTFRDDEAVELVFDTMPIADYLGLWDKFTPRMQTPLTYITRLVELDSTISVDEAGPVQTRAFDVGFTQ